MTPEKKFFKRPTKEETLAIKQEERIQRWRLNHFRKRLPGFSPQRWVGVGEILGVTILFLTNLFLLYPFFGHEDKVNVFSAPVIPVLANMTEKFIPFSYGVRIWLLVFLILFPLSFYYFVKEISGRKLTGFISSFIVSLPIGIFLPLRINLGLFAQDGAHIASLTLIPLVCLLLLRFLKRGAFWTGILSALGAMIIALSSPIGFVVLFIFMGVITFSEMLLGHARLKLFRFLMILLLTAGFSAFWYNPKFALLTIYSPQGLVVRKTLANLLPISFFLLPILGVFGYLLFENQPQFQPMFIAFFLTVAFGLFSLGAGVAHPTPSRFLPAFGISFAFLLGILLAWLFDFLRYSAKLKRFLKITNFSRRLMAAGLISFVFLLIFMTIVISSRGFRELEQSQVLGLTAEQTVGVWQIKEKTSGVESVFGYMITGLTVFGAIILKTKLGL